MALSPWGQGNAIWLLALCGENPLVIGGFPSQRASNDCFDVFFDVRPNKLLNKQSSWRWFEMEWCSYDVTLMIGIIAVWYGAVPSIKTWQIFSKIYIPTSDTPWRTYDGKVWGLSSVQSMIWARFDIKMPSYQYRISHCGDKRIIRLSYLHNGISYTGKMTSLYWMRSLVLPLQMTCFNIVS